MLENIISEKRLRDEIKKCKVNFIREKDEMENEEFVGVIKIVEDEYRDIELEFSSERGKSYNLAAYVVSHNYNLNITFRTRIFEIFNTWPSPENINKVFGEIYANLMAYLEINNFEIGE